MQAIQDPVAAAAPTYWETQLELAQAAEQDAQAKLGKAQREVAEATDEYEQAEHRQRVGLPGTPPHRLGPAVVDAREKRDRCAKAFLQAQTKRSQASENVAFGKRGAAMRQLPASLPHRAI